MSEASEFFKDIWCKSGIAWLAAITKQGKITQLRFEHPEEDGEIDKFIETQKGKNLYGCVNLTSTRVGRLASEVQMSKVIYADLDDKINPNQLKLKPNYLLRTSPGKYQAFWILEQAVPAEYTSEVSRRIASYHRLDACFDKVRLMRIVGTPNYKYDEPFEVEIVGRSRVIYRLGDFHMYPEVQFKYIDHTYRLVDIEDVPKYADLDIEEQERIDRYTERAVEYEILKLDELAQLKPGQRMEYSGRSGFQEYGWERGQMWVSRCLVELANAPWNNYTIQEAEKDFKRNAPTDSGWTKQHVHDKWESAINANHHREFRYRRYPEEWGC